MTRAHIASDYVPESAVAPAVIHLAIVPSANRRTPANEFAKGARGGGIGSESQRDG
jgi:hypothetical protein